MHDLSDAVFMDVIDASWIKSKLKGYHGEKAELAAFLGISRDKLYKTLAGGRRVQPEEIPKVLAFFENARGSVDLKEIDPELYSLAAQLTPEERAVLRSVAKGQISARPEED